MKSFILVSFLTVSLSGFSQGLYEYYSSKATESFGEGDHEKVIYFLNKSIKMYPDSIVTYAFRADAYMTMEKFELALDDLNYCRIHGYKPLEVHGILGICKAQLGQFDAAIDEFDAALKLTPKDTGLLLNKAQVYNLKEEYKQAKSILDGYVFTASHFQGYSVRANSNKSLGLYEEAIEDYKQFTSLYPIYSGSYLGWAECLKELGRNEEMCEVLYNYAQSTYQQDVMKKYHEEDCAKILDRYIMPPPEESAPNPPAQIHR